jgi:hypothetical protein
MLGTRSRCYGTLFSRADIERNSFKRLPWKTAATLVKNGQILAVIENLRIPVYV